MDFAAISSFAIIFALKVVSAYGEWNTKDFVKREHSLVKPYYGSGIDIPYWEFTGSTIVTPNYVRLTPDVQSKQGALWNTAPVLLRNWELQVEFKVHGAGTDLFGDGLAVWYAKDRLKEGPVFGSTDYFHGLAIILDTYSNHNGPHNHAHPFISAMVNNGSLHYDHDRDGTHTQLAGCEAGFRNVNYPTYLAVRYENDVLSVLTDIENKKAWAECFNVSGVFLPTGYYLGLSATTGDLSDNHDIVSVRLFDLDMPDDPKANEDRSKIQPSATFAEPPREHIEDEKPSSLSGIKIFLLMLLGSVVVVVCVVIGIMLYQKQNENSRKRFY